MRATSVLLALTLAGVPLAGSPGPALAAWSHSPAAGVNVSAWPDDQRNPVVCGDGDGGVFIAWSDHRNSLSSADVYVQRLDRAGRPLWTPGGVLVCATDNGQFPQGIVPDGQGGAIVVWVDWRTYTTTGTDVYAGRVDADGNVLWGATGVVVSAATGDQGNNFPPAVASDGRGGVVIVWHDTRNAATSPDIYGQWLNASGVNQWTANGRALCTAAGQQYDVSVDVMPDGDLVAAWMDDRNSATTGWDVYAQKMSPTGSARWTSQGVVVCNATDDQWRPRVRFRTNGDVFVVFQDGRTPANGDDIYMCGLRAFNGEQQFVANGWPVCAVAQDQDYPTIVSDAAGGTIVTWYDRRNLTTSGWDVYAQRFEGSNAAKWTANGVPVCTEYGDQFPTAVVPDALGGAVFVYADGRHLGYEYFAQRLTREGAPLWAAGGVALASHPYSASTSANAATDGRGGAVLAFNRAEAPGSLAEDVYAVRVDEWGILGGEPVVTSVADVPNDQGGAVRVSWQASPLDTDPAFRNVTDYLVFRAATTGALAAARTTGRLRAVADAGEWSVGDVVALPAGAQVLYWEMVGSQPAYHLPTYAFTAPTPGDSVAGSNPWSAFMVLARAGTSMWWESEPDSGYSTDDLAPPTPAPFTGAFGGGVAQLAWGASGAPDLAGYRVHRGTSPGFEPSPANLAVELTERAWTDPLGAPAIYKLVAVDVHGNASPPALLVPAGVLDAPGPDAPRAHFAGLSPNPLGTGMAGRVSFGLAGREQVRLEVFDLAGRRAATLLDGALEPGEHAVGWDGRDASGARLAPGAYVLRLSAGGRIHQAKCVVVR